MSHISQNEWADDHQLQALLLKINDSDENESDTDFHSEIADADSASCHSDYSDMLLPDGALSTPAFALLLDAYEHSFYSQHRHKTLIAPSALSEEEYRLKLRLELDFERKCERPIQAMEWPDLVLAIYNHDLPEF